MSQKTKKVKKKLTSEGGPARRKERRIATSATYLPRGLAATGLISAVVLGAGVTGQWVLDPAFEYAPYLVAVGGLGVGIALGIGPRETAVAVGDAGVAVERSRETLRMPWYQIKSITLQGDRLVVASAGSTLAFSVGANPGAAALVLSEAAQRVPDVLDVDKSAAEKLPDPTKLDVRRVDVSDDQLAGLSCANSKQVIRLEEDARLCPRCSQVYHRQSVPSRCVSCDAELEGRTLRA